MQPHPPSPDTNADPRRRWRVAPPVALAAILTAAGAVVCAQPQVPDGPTKPAAREGAWMDLHEQFLVRARQGGVDLLFLGDSITQGWHGERAVWDRYYGARRAANFGIGGDGTQNVLWRIDHGELDGIKPKVVVLMIGTNNVRTATPAEIAQGVTAVVKRVRDKLPETKILLLGVFPRSKSPDDPARIRLEAVNARIARLDDNKWVEYLDIGRRFLNEDGTLSPEIMPDYLHLSRKGYRIWADAMEPKLWEMLNGPPR